MPQHGKAIIKMLDRAANAVLNPTHRFATAQLAAIAAGEILLLCFLGASAENSRRQMDRQPEPSCVSSMLLAKPAALTLS